MPAGPLDMGHNRFDQARHTNAVEARLARRNGIGHPVLRRHGAPDLFTFNNFRQRCDPRAPDRAQTYRSAHLVTLVDPDLDLLWQYSPNSGSTWRVQRTMRRRQTPTVNLQPSTSRNHQGVGSLLGTTCRGSVVPDRHRQPGFRTVAAMSDAFPRRIDERLEQQFAHLPQERGRNAVMRLRLRLLCGRRSWRAPYPCPAISSG